MNILHLMSARRYVGEAGRVLDLAEAQLTSGHQVMLILRRGYDVAEEAAKRGLPHTLGDFSSGFNPFTDWADVRQIRDEINKRSTDIIHVHRSKEHWLAAWALTGVSERPIMVRSRHVVMPISPHLLNRYLYGKCTHGIVFVSQQVRSAVQDSLGEIGTPSRVIEGGLRTRGLHFPPVEEGRSFRNNLGIPLDAPLIAHVARIARVKGQHLLLEALPAVLQNFPDTVVVFAYNRRVKKYLAELKQKSTDLGVHEHVRWADNLDSIWPLLISCSVSVVASTGSEGWSRVAVESLHAGAPVVATRVGSLPEIVDDGATGFLIPPDDPPALSEALTHILSDQDVRSNMMFSAKSAAGKFTIENTAENTLNFYSDLITAKESPP